MTAVDVGDGLALNVHAIGSGPTVVFIAGFGLDHRIWDGQVEHLAESHRVICVDLLGTGQSSKPLDGYSTANQAELVIAALDKVGVERFSLVGHSFGGMVAFNIAASKPDRVTKLMLVGSNAVRAGRSDTFPFGANGDKMSEALISAERANRVVSRRATLAAGFAVEPEEAVLDFLTGVFLDMPSWSAVACFRAMYATDQIEMIDHTTMQVAQIVGERDRVHSPAGAEWLQARLHASTLEVVPSVGHYPMFENPAALNDFLVRVLAGSDEH
ncbi:alpha/beta fold hydrolase [Rhodococcus koreensis]|uniref:alpha/beta fold hydrolase n=1 Tax=Rhodococcus koreensis TaxID=99653 RepID=UPI0036713BED